MIIDHQGVNAVGGDNEQILGKEYRLVSDEDREHYNEEEHQEYVVRDKKKCSVIINILMIPWKQSKCQVWKMTEIMRYGLLMRLLPQCHLPDWSDNKQRQEKNNVGRGSSPKKHGINESQGTAWFW